MRFQGRTPALLAGGAILLLAAAAAVGSQLIGGGRRWQPLVDDQAAAAPASAILDASPTSMFSPSSMPTRGQPAPVAGRKCTNPVFVTSDRNGGWSTQGYYVHNNMWNDSVPLGPETLKACAHNNWFVVSNQTNSAGAVKTYPNVHKDYRNQAISSFNTLMSSFAATGPKTGIYNIAYDIWINGIASSGSTEIMIWTDNYKQTPAGSKIRTVTLSGRSYDVWKTSNSRYIAFVATSTVTSGTVNLLEILKYPIGQGWLGADATLGQICYGVEIVSTGGAEQTFSFTDFSITA